MPRLFFALWPDDETRKQLQAVMQSIPPNIGRAVPLENLHITLAFLGQVNEEITKGLEAAANRIRTQKFELKLDTIGCWRKSGILWLAPADIPEKLGLLVSRVNEVSAASGITLDGRPFKPHIALARKAGMPPERDQIPSVIWQVESFTLVESITHHTGAQYRVLDSWPLLN